VLGLSPSSSAELSEEEKAELLRKYNDTSAKSRAENARINKKGA
jgi:hypothetical protein